MDKQYNMILKFVDNNGEMQTISGTWDRQDCEIIYGNTNNVVYFIMECLDGFPVS